MTRWGRVRPARAAPRRAAGPWATPGASRRRRGVPGWCWCSAPAVPFPTTRDPRSPGRRAAVVLMVPPGTVGPLVAPRAGCGAPARKAPDDPGEGGRWGVPDDDLAVVAPPAAGGGGPVSARGGPGPLAAVSPPMLRRCTTSTSRSARVARRYGRSRRRGLAAQSRVPGRCRGPHAPGRGGESNSMAVRDAGSHRSPACHPGQPLAADGAPASRSIARRGGRAG